MICFGIGLALTIGFIYLARVPYLGRVIQAVLGLLWGFLVYLALDNIFHYTEDTGLMEGLRQYDQLTWWVIVILVNVIFIVLHISMFNKSLQTLDFKKIFKKKRKNIYQESGGESPQPQNRTYEENYTPVQQPDPEVSSFFNGCDTPEKPDKRYKSLAKAFHPNTEAGDNESMQKLNAEYERLKSKFTDNAD